MKTGICKKCLLKEMYSDTYNDNDCTPEIMVTNELGYCNTCCKKYPIEDLLIIDIPKKENYTPQVNEEYCGYKGSKDVLFFIKQFLAHNNSVDSETILKDQFNTGYCYYFAVILKAAFNRGEVCWCAPYGHICWVDDDGTPYDIYGICISEADHFIPVSYLGECLTDFLHIDKVHCSTEEEIQVIINRYLNFENEKKMRHVISDKLYKPEEYLKLVTGEDYILSSTINQVEAVEKFLDEKMSEGTLWSHALTEIEHISNNNDDMGVVLVDCLVRNEETNETEHCYRWFEVRKADDYDEF